MDDRQFDALTRVYASKRSRRGALSAILGVALLSQGSHVLANPGRAEGKCHSESHKRGRGRGPALNCHKLPVPENSDLEFCCEDGSCSCGGNCCARGEECFQTGINPQQPDALICCTEQALKVCGQELCCDIPLSTCGQGCASGIAGSYRRP